MGKNKKFSGIKKSLQDFQGDQSSGTVREIIPSGKNVVVTIKTNLTRTIVNDIAQVKCSDPGRNQFSEGTVAHRPSSRAQIPGFEFGKGKHENVENAPNERATDDKSWRNSNPSNRTESRNDYAQKARSTMERKNRNEPHNRTFDNKVTKDKHDMTQTRRSFSNERKDKHVQDNDYSDNSNIAGNTKTDIVENNPIEDPNEATNAKSIESENWRERPDNSNTSNVDCSESNKSWETQRSSNRQRGSNAPRDNKMDQSRRYNETESKTYGKERSNNDRRDREPIGNRKYQVQKNYSNWDKQDESKFSSFSNENVSGSRYGPTNKRYGNDSRQTPRSSDSRADMKCMNYEQRTSHQDSQEYKEFLEWKKHSDGNKKCEISEKNGDLFTAPAEYSLCHCVAEDLRMGSGIAVTFRQKFGRVKELMQQEKKTGDVAILTDKERFIYYLITKRYSKGKPTNDTLLQSLLKLKEHMSAHNVTKLAMPTIGCGLDRLVWGDVQEMIEYVFRDTAVEIVVYLFEQYKKRKRMNDTRTNLPNKKNKYDQRQISSNKPPKGRDHIPKCCKRGGGGKANKAQSCTNQDSDETRDFFSGHRARDNTSLYRDIRPKRISPNDRPRQKIQFY